MANKKRFLAVVACLFFICNGVVGHKGEVWVVDQRFPEVPLAGGGLWAQLKEAVERLGYRFKWTGSLRGADQAKYIACFNASWREFFEYRSPAEKLILFLWEPPTVFPDIYNPRFHGCFCKVATWADDMVDNKQYHKFHLPYFIPHSVKWPQEYVPFHEKKLCTTICCNKDSRHPLSLYGERRRVVDFFDKNHCDDFDLYGHGWSNRDSKNYKGTVPSKVDCVKQYRFCFAYENMRDMNGYVTEKMLDVFMAGSVPIYWGAGNIERYVPKNCFIDPKDFADLEQLYQFLKSMPEQEYQNYLNNIKRYLHSDQVLAFSVEFFIHRFISIIEPGYDKTVALTDVQRGIVARAHRHYGDRV